MLVTNFCYKFLAASLIQFSPTEKILMSTCKQYCYLLRQIQIGPELLIYAKFNY